MFVSEFWTLREEEKMPKSNVFQESEICLMYVNV